MSNGVAHVSFRGGGTFLPARNPYDRQLLVEHVLSRVRAKGRVQVLVNDERWMVHLHRGPSAGCLSCGYFGDSACYSAVRNGGPYCVKCAFGDFVASAPPERMAERRVGS